MFPILLGKTKELEAKCADLQRQIDEGGGGGGATEPLLFTVTEDAVGMVGDKSYKQLKTAILAGRNVVVYSPATEFYGVKYGFVTGFFETLGNETDPVSYYLSVLIGSDTWNFATTDPDEPLIYKW